MVSQQDFSNTVHHWSTKKCCPKECHMLGMQHIRNATHGCLISTLANNAQLFAVLDRSYFFCLTLFISILVLPNFIFS